MKRFLLHLWINVGNTNINSDTIKNLFILDPEWELTEILQAVICYVNDRINNTYKFIKPFLDNKMSIFEEYGAFNTKRFLCIHLLYRYII